MSLSALRVITPLVVAMLPPAATEMVPLVVMPIVPEPLALKSAFTVARLIVPTAEPVRCLVAAIVID